MRAARRSVASRRPSTSQRTRKSTPRRTSRSSTTSASSSWTRRSRRRKRRLWRSSMADDLLAQIRGHGVVPRHVAVIMDGNGRWARERSLPRPLGHRAGMNAVRDVVEGAIAAGVEVLTLFAFSAENWQRPTTEISALTELLEAYVAEGEAERRQHGDRVHVVGGRPGPEPGARAPRPRVDRHTRGGR